MEQNTKREIITPKQKLKRPDPDKIAKKNAEKDPELTLGSQILNKINKNKSDKGPEAREVTLEWGKKFLKDLEVIVKNPKYLDWPKIYIKILAKKQVYTAHAVNVVYGVTNTPPSPDWKNALYSYDRKKDQWILEWLLPQGKEIARIILAHKSGFDPFLVKCIEKFLEQKLLGQASYCESPL